MHTIINVSVILYGFEFWSHSVRGKREFRKSESRKLKRIFGPKGEEITGGGKKLYNGELHNLWSPSNSSVLLGRWTS
jgi:hypothetical protein